MTDEDLWRKRFLIFAAVRIAGLLIFFLGLAIAFSDLVRPGGWKLLGGVLAIAGIIDAMIAPRVLKRAWDRLEE